MMIVFKPEIMIIKNRTKLVWQPLIRDLLFYALSVGLLVCFFVDGSISSWEAFSFVVGYVVYIVALYKWKSIFPR